MNNINPYNFVPLTDKPNRDEGFPGLHRFQEESLYGKISCILKAETDLISLGEFTTIKATQEDSGNTSNEKEKQYLFNRNSANVPALRGTSIKGMIRSVYECIEPSCVPHVKLSGAYDKPVPKIPGQKKPQHTFCYESLNQFSHTECADHRRLCPGCRLFGNLANENKSLKGRLSFSDARLCEKNSKSQKVQKLTDGQVCLPVLGMPKPHHCATYGKSRTGGGPIAGRKFYYHHSKNKNWKIDNESATKRNLIVKEFAPKGTEFEFEIFCEGLTERELTVLAVTLELDKGLGHKIGLGKAIGLGSCTIKIDWSESTVSNSRLRYTGNGSTIDIEKTTNRIRPEIILTDELRGVLRLDKETTGNLIGYPSPKDYKSPPFSQPIDALGVFGGATASVKGLHAAEKAASAPIGPPPKISGHETVAWLKEVYTDCLVFVHPNGSEEMRPRNACQAKKHLHVSGSWFILWGEKASKPAPVT